MRGGIVLVEAFGHVETSHFRATFRLELGSQQRGAERGQGAEQRGQDEPCHGAGRGGRAPTFGAGRKVAGGRGVGGSRAESEGEGSWRRRRRAGGGDAGRKVELGLARQATVPGARRPARGGGGGRGGGARPRGAEARAGDLPAPRGQRSGRAGRRRDRGAGKEGKVAGAAGAEEGVRGGGGRSRRAARAARRWSALLARLGSARSALGRTAVPSSALPLIDWPACAATLDKLGPAGGTQGEGAGGGGAGDGREQAGPGREKTWKRGWIRSVQIHFLGGPHRARNAPSRDTPSRDTPRGTPPSFPPPGRRGACPPPPTRGGQADFSGVKGPSPRGPRAWGLETHVRVLGLLRAAT